MDAEIKKWITLRKTHINSIRTINTKLRNLSAMSDFQFKIWKTELETQEGVLWIGE